MSVGIFIPGRLASERCPNKLIAPIGDTCLWEIACAKLESVSDEFNKYALAYDEPLIEIAEQYDITVIQRDKETAFADSPLQFIFKDMKQVPDTHLMFLNPCLAFLEKDTIERVLSDFTAKGYDYATSTKLFVNYLFDKDGTPLTHIDYSNINTKSIEPLHQMAHCFHIFSKDEFFETGQMLQSGHAMYTVNEKETIDVDMPEELELVQKLWEYYAE